MIKKPRAPTLLAGVNVKRKAAGKPELSQEQAFKLINERHMNDDTDFDIAEYLTQVESK
jgi:hypothetical protein